MCVSNEDRSPVGIDSCDTAPTPTGFAEIVGDDFPVLDRPTMPLLTKFEYPLPLPQL
jgi:hypothetical protein